MGADSTIEWTHHTPSDCDRMILLGKKVAGRLLDGREWSEFPGKHLPNT